MKDNRIAELIELAASEGIELPMSPEEIVALEDAGNIVDLVTGDVLPNAGRWLVEPTVIGEATAAVLSAETL